MRVVKLLAVTIIAAGLAACAGRTPPTTAVVTVEKPAIMVPSVDKVKLNDVQWYIITKDAKPGDDAHIDTVWKKSSGDSLFAVNSRDYEDLSVNTAQLVRVIKQLQAQVAAYKQYYQQDTDKSKEPADAKK